MRFRSTRMARGIIAVGLLFSAAHILPAGEPLAPVTKHQDSFVQRAAYYRSLTDAELAGIRPSWPNPYLSFLPHGATPDYAYWQEVMRRGAINRMQRLRRTDAQLPGPHIVEAGILRTEQRRIGGVDTGVRVVGDPGEVSGGNLVVRGSIAPMQTTSPALSGTTTGDDIPSTPATGGGDGARPQGLATAELLVLELSRGDVLGASVSGAAGSLNLFAPDTRLLLSSSQDLSFVYPPESPLPGGGTAVLSYVIPRSGEYMLRVDGTPGAYILDLQVLRPALESMPGMTGIVTAASQILFIDFDGATVNSTALFGAPPGFESAPLSPLSLFLSGWSLAPADEDAVIDETLKVITENLSRDLRVLGNNGDRDSTTNAGEFDIEIRNSRDHIDPWGQPNVSRVIVGGTMNELGVQTIGIAQSIDPGNYGTSETAVVLLDLLSSTDIDPNSLNLIPLDLSASKAGLVATAIGNIVAHEAGHFFGNFHTDQFNADENLMDQGGNLQNTVGVGPDGRFGSPDDADVDFGEDVFVPNEGLNGVEDTLNTIAFGLSTGPNHPPTISAIPDITITENGSTGPIPFTVGDVDDFDVPGSLALAASSSNTTLVPPGAMSFSSATTFVDNEPRSLVVTPARGESGASNITVTVSDGQDSASRTFTLTVTDVPNQPPVANAGADRTVETGSNVRLDGTLSADPDGVVTAYLWRQLAGSTVALNNAATATPDFQAPATAQSLSFQLTVTDNEGAASSDTVLITVVGPSVASGGSGGGCALRSTDDSGFDPLLPVLLLVSLGQILATAIRRRPSQSASQ